MNFSPGDFFLAQLFKLKNFLGNFFYESDITLAFCHLCRLGGPMDFIYAPVTRPGAA